MCKLKLDYVVVLQSNLMKNHTPLVTKKNIIVKIEKKKVKLIEDSLVLNKKRRKINLKSIEEEPIVERVETEFNCLHCDKGKETIKLIKFSNNEIKLYSF